ncbi:MAG: hypothetical protein JW925_03840 [Syntrophaceae bacterium]|nr:hypothetical protein [Syntrophaceae bacterium]
MNKKIFCLVVALCVCVFFLISCSGGKNAAELAIKAAEEAVNVTKAEAVKIVPDEVKSLEDTLTAVKEKFINGDYKAAMEEATTLANKAKEVLDAAKAKKEELTIKWTEISQGLPKMVEDIQAKIDSLSKVKKLPASVTKEGFEEAKAGLASVKDEWTKIQTSFTSGNFAEAVNAATSLKDKAVKIMESLGMSVPSSETPAEAPAPAAVPTPAK